MDYTLQLLGMDPSTRLWASSRLAPIQIVTWGHPSTTGFTDVIDYYIISNMFYTHQMKTQLTYKNSHLEHGADRDPLDVCGTSSGTQIDNVDGFIDDILLGTNKNFPEIHSMDHPVVGGSHESEVHLCNGAIIYPQERFSEQLIWLDSMGVYFNRPFITGLVRHTGEQTEYIKQGNDSSTSINLIKLCEDTHPGLLTEFKKMRHMKREALIFNKIMSVMSNGSQVMHSVSNSTNTDGLPIELVRYYNTYQELLIYRPSAYYEYLRQLINAQAQSPGRDQLLSLLDMKASHSGADIVDPLMQMGKVHVLLCPQSLPKLHPLFDILLKRLLNEIPNTFIVFMGNAKKSLWMKTIEHRWSKLDIPLERIIWMPPLTPEQYVQLLAIGDVMLDPFPFGGGVTVLEAFAVCNPVVTLPSLQNVPSLAAGFIEQMLQNNKMKHELSRSTVTNDALQTLLVSSINEYVAVVQALLQDTNNTNPTSLQMMRKHVCESNDVLYNNQASVDEWQRILLNIWEVEYNTDI